ncbi:diadenosine tetraphosphate (Ap4A) hydrolase andother HIT family hydrolases [Weissella oryzae SG25]|uniref:Diadenosine tetraphosphate (Ap4A) hydrolase andother HIT family hydrolases n=2 Tax=Weissella TaxID=46255 RepID=A0A069CSE1_WEIOS|nr:diadenosine tetraphosphate (Ap4A) hydrolase andother HIT family hydrolases [Weissella oryzae SG25]
MKEIVTGENNMADIFDKIISGEIPAYKVYEDDDVLAFLDLSQATPGHTLVVPKAEVANIFEYDTDLAQRVLGKLPMIARAIQASDPAIIGMNIISNNGAAAGQSVFHSHFHLLPRYADDGIVIPAPDHSSDYDADTYAAIAAKISANFN